MPNINEMLTDLNSGISTNSREFPILVKLDGSSSGMQREKLSADGRPTYSVAGTVMQLRDGQPAPAKNAFVHTLEPVTAAYDLFTSTLLRAEGKVVIKPFVSNDRIAYSMCVDKLVPVTVQQGDQK